MIFLPVSCERCPSIALVSTEDCIDGKSLCGACGGIVHVLPGCAFPEGDVALFDALAAALAASTISSFDARRLASAVEDAQMAGSEHSAFSSVVQSVPGLKPIEAIVGSYRARRRQALTMLATILRGRAERRHSGIIATPQASASETSRMNGSRRR
jgi:hypothetical protein